MLFGADDPRPWTASDSLLEALPNASRIVLDSAGHAPWAERPADTRQVILGALRPRLPKLFCKTFSANVPSGHGLCAGGRLPRVG
jgi:hypothetical protein